MTRTEAIARINQGLGFRSAGLPLESNIILMLQEAQRNLERGKTLPKFLLVEDFALSLLVGTHTVAKPTGFLRESDETKIRFYPLNSTKPRFLDRRFLIDALQANSHVTAENPEAPEQPAGPSVYVIRQSVIDFIVTADTNYTLYLDYYKAGTVLTTDAENIWLANAPEWLIGEAGVRIARDLRDGEAVATFTEMRQMARAAIFAEDITAETASGPLQMGANQ